MAFDQARLGDRDELRVPLQAPDIRRSAVPHGAAESALQLVEDVSDRSFVGNDAFDAFRDEFGGLGAFLEVTVGAAAAHRSQAAHAPVRLVAPAITQEDRKSTRLNSSHVAISYAVFCLKKKTLLGKCG